jgi:hypothetical protein
MECLQWFPQQQSSLAKKRRQQVTKHSHPVHASLQSDGQRFMHPVEAVL